MALQSLRHFVFALAIALVLWVPTTPAQASPAARSHVAATPLSASRIAQIRDSGPPVMQRLADQLDSAPAPYSPVTSRAAATPLAVTNPRVYREVFGFAFANSLGDPSIGYPSWNMSLLSTVAYFGLHVDWSGAYSSGTGLSVWNDPNGPVPGFISAAHASGTKVVLTIMMFDSTNGTPNMCSALQAPRSTLTINNTVAEVRAKGIDGVNVDYESDNSQCTDPSTGAVQSSQSLFTAFVHNMRAALPAGSYLSVDTYSGAAGYRNSAGAYLGFFDIGALNNDVDSFMVMAYDMEYANWDSPPLNCPSFCIGPTSPLTTYQFNQSQVSTEYSAVVAPSKVIMGIPYYGRKVCVAGYAPSNAPPNAVASTSASADGYLDASTEQGYSLNSSYYTHREVRDTQGATRWDTFTSSSAQCTREMYWDDATALGYKYDHVINTHLRGVGIFALNYGGGAPELWDLINLKFGHCSQAAIAADHSVPQIPGTAITFTGTALCAGTGQFRFLISPPSGGWSIAQNYSTSPSWTWNTSNLGLGTYRVEVDARNLGSTADYDTYAVFSFRLALCVTPSVSTDKASPQLPSTTVNITASVTCQGTPEYQFVEQAPGAAAAVVQPYGPASTFAWSTAPAAYGGYGFTVNVRTTGTTVASESNQNVTYTRASCLTPTFTTDKASPQPTGTQVRLSASATCDGAAQFRFQIQPPAAPFAVVQDFGSGAAYTWNASTAGGTYGLEVDAKSASAPVAALSSSLLAYELDACSGGALGVSPASPQTPGTMVQLTGSATCPAAAQYQFTITKPGGGTIVQSYSASPTMSWNTTGLPYGSYGLELDVRDAGASSPFETRATSTFAVAAAACTTPTVTSNLASPQGTGVPITFTAATTTCPSPLYRFYAQDPSGGWSLVRDYGTSPAFTWPAGGPAGSWHIEADVRDVTRPVNYDQYTVVPFTLTACSGSTLTPDRPSPQEVGATVVLTGAATCLGKPEFRFFVQVSGGWSLVQQYSSNNTYRWYGGASGLYRFEVDIRDIGSSSDLETYTTLSYGINGPCTAAALAANPSAATVGATVTLSGSASGCPVPNYRFWVGQNGGWKVLQDYSSASTASWNTTGYAPGSYDLEVDVRSQGSTASYEKVSTIYAYPLKAPNCGSVSISPSPASTVTAGASVTFTAAATSCTNSGPLYQFWTRPASGAWTIAQAWSSTATFAWDTSRASGGYYVSVWAKDSASPTSTFDANATAFYTVKPAACASVTLTPAPPSSASSGTQVTFTAAAAGCTNPNPVYQFWSRPAASSTWTSVQAYSATTTFNWNTAGSSGPYYVSVWSKDAASPTAGFDANATVSYTVNAGTCASVTIAPAPPSPSAPGTQVTFTAGATGCTNPSPLYEFWIRPAGSSSWTMVQAYSTNATLTWTSPTTAGGYYVSVWAKDASSVASSFERNATTLYNLS